MDIHAPHTLFVFLSYGLAAIIFIALCVHTALEHRHLDKLEISRDAQS